MVSESSKSDGLVGVFVRIRALLLSSDAFDGEALANPELRRGFFCNDSLVKEDPAVGSVLAIFYDFDASAFDPADQPALRGAEVRLTVVKDRAPPRLIVIVSLRSEGNSMTVENLSKILGVAFQRDTRYRVGDGHVFPPLSSPNGNADFTSVLVGKSGDVQILISTCGDGSLFVFRAEKTAPH